MGSQVWSLLSLGVGLNLVLGALVAAFKLPIYLDSLGTVLVAALAGPWAGCLAGGCGVALLGLSSPTALAFLPVGAAVGLLAGAAARLGAFGKSWSAGLAGALVGCVCAAISAPISSTLFGGVTGGGTDLMVAVFRAGGLSTLQAAFSQGLTVDPLDKAVTFLLVQTLLQVLPRRAIAAFPLAERLPLAFSSPPVYRPSVKPVGSLGAPQPGRFSADIEPADTFPQAPTAWKLLAALSVLLAAGSTDSPRALSAALLTLWLTYGLVAPNLTWKVTRRLLVALLPLALSLIVIHGLVAHQPEETRYLWLGLSWSLSGLYLAWRLLVRVALALLMVSVFLATTPLQRIAELLLRCRVPYPLVFLLLTGANLGTRLRERWTIVKEAQQARGLHLRRGGPWVRVRTLLGLLTPTLGAVICEIPLRAASLESRGFLTARPRATIPLQWTGETAPTPLGLMVQVFIILASLGLLLWL
jgi:energy-coupling factor transport system substrate-specific component